MTQNIQLRRQEEGSAITTEDIIKHNEDMKFKLQAIAVTTVKIKTTINTKINNLTYHTVKYLSYTH